jgi:hypothetical protein
VKPDHNHESPNGSERQQDTMDQQNQYYSQVSRRIVPIMSNPDLAERADGRSTQVESGGIPSSRRTVRPRRTSVSSRVNGLLKEVEVISYEWYELILSISRAGWSRVYGGQAPYGGPPQSSKPPALFSLCLGTGKRLRTSILNIDSDLTWILQWDTQVLHPHLNKVILLRKRKTIRGVVDLVGCVVREWPRVAVWTRSSKLQVEVDQGLRKTSRGRFEEEVETATLREREAGRLYVRPSVSGPEYAAYAKRLSVHWPSPSEGRTSVIGEHFLVHVCER